MKLFNSKATIVMFNITNGFCWEASFDINTGLYTLSCEKYFKTPIEAEEDIKNFCKENELEYEIDWSSL